jgi:hypothetical protein
LLRKETMKRWRNRHPHENWLESHQGDWVRYEDAQAEIERLQVELDIERNLHQRASEDHASAIAERPMPHGVVYDRPGWLCSICGFWNNIKDRHCAGIHLQSDGASEERLVGAVHEKCPHEDCHAAWRCTKCGEFRGECPPMRPHE